MHQTLDLTIKYFSSLYFTKRVKTQVKIILMSPIFTANVSRKKAAKNPVLIPKIYSAQFYSAYFVIDFVAKIKNVFGKLYKECFGYT